MFCLIRVRDEVWMKEKGAGRKEGSAFGSKEMKTIAGLKFNYEREMRSGQLFRENRSKQQLKVFSRNVVISLSDNYRRSIR
jgi:hypothetical protein